MPFMIKTIDKPDSATLRAELRPAHLDYLRQREGQILAAGAMLNDDGSPGNGGLILIATDNRAEAEAFIAEDPFTRGQLFATVEVVRWRKAFFNFECLV